MLPQKEKKSNQQLNDKTKQRRYWPHLQLIVNTKFEKFCQRNTAINQTEGESEFKEPWHRLEEVRVTVITCPVQRPLWQPFAVQIIRNKIQNKQSKISDTFLNAER